VLGKCVKKHLEKVTGHQFKDQDLLEVALTHSSAQNIGIGDYERLEFLGDRVLGLVIAEMLFHLFPTAKEGELAIRLNTLVDTETCAQIAEKIGLPDLIRVGADMKWLGRRRLSNVYADVVEALIAVLYTDGGLAASYPFIHRYWSERIHRPEGQLRDAKTELQEWAHRQGSVQPVYRVLTRVGPDHAPIFEVELQIPGFSLVNGKGESKRQAEQAAAKEMLYREGVWKQEIHGYMNDG